MAVDETVTFLYSQSYAMPYGTTNIHCEVTGGGGDGGDSQLFGPVNGQVDSTIYGGGGGGGGGFKAADISVNPPADVNTLIVITIGEHGGQSKVQYLDTVVIAPGGQAGQTPDGTVIGNDVTTRVPGAGGIGGVSDKSGGMGANGTKGLSSYGGGGGGGARVVANGGNAIATAGSGLGGGNGGSYSGAAGAVNTGGGGGGAGGLFPTTGVGGAGGSGKVRCHFTG